jgi:hypothetical protein
MNKPIKLKPLYTSIVIIFVALCGTILYFHKSSTLKPTPTIFKCPEKYAETDAGTTEYRNALIDWTTEFFKTQPNATMSDWSMAKTQLWVDNNCTVAIERSKLSGKVADLKPWEKVDYEVQNAINNTTETPTPPVSKYIPTGSSINTQDVFDYSNLGVVKVAPEIGFKTGIKEYPLLKWKTETIKEKSSIADIDIQYPQFIGSNTKSLNKYISDIILGQVAKDKNPVKEAVAENPDYIPDLESIANLSSRYRIIGVSNGIVSLELVITDFTGGGNGNHDIPTVINWDLKTDRLLQPEELFCSKNYLSILSPIVREVLIKNYSLSPDVEQPISADTMNWIQDGTAPNADKLNNFLISPKGLIVVFPPYQVFSGSEGVVHVLIPSSYISNLLCLP